MSNTPDQPKETILLVDDNDGDRLFMSMALGEQGYRVLEAASGEVGLQVFKDHADEIGLVLADILMPGMDGIQLVQNVRRISPNMKVIFTSSYKPRFESEANERPADFVEKSSDTLPLLSKVREVLDNKGLVMNLLNKVF